MRYKTSPLGYLIADPLQEKGDLIAIKKKDPLPRDG
jgi:hypothetical protein